MPYGTSRFAKTVGGLFSGRCVILVAPRFSIPLNKRTSRDELPVVWAPGKKPVREHRRGTLGRQRLRLVSASNTSADAVGLTGSRE